MAEATNAFWGQMRSETSNGGMVVYSAIVRPSLVFGALVWWPATEKEWTKKLPVGPTGKNVS